MPPCIDCYVLVQGRSKSFADKFLDHFLPHRRETASEYEVPQHADSPRVVYKTADELLLALEDQPAECHAIYWANTDPGRLRTAIVAPTNDGGTVYGLSIDDEDDDGKGMAAACLEKMLALFGRTCPAYFGWEEVPPNRMGQFLARKAELASG